jgi:hypothetical protein
MKYWQGLLLAAVAEGVALAGKSTDSWCYWLTAFTSYNATHMSFDWRL